MIVEVIRKPGRKLFMIDGKPYLRAEAAQLLGMKPETLERRVERGTDLLKPVKRYSGEL